ncbi:MAG: KR domain-containing protein [Anaerolineaceae bacterium]|nr:KR domain-containing protein [Anaerolineaceae bacterium]
MRDGLINKDSVILVSGGARGITAQCVMHLAKNFGGHYILLGRTVLEKEEPAWAKNISGESEIKQEILTYLKEKGENPTPIKVQKIFNRIMSNREIRNTLENIRNADAKADYLSVDITNTHETYNKVRDLIDPANISGIIHGAGNLADKLIEKKTIKDFESVFNPKTIGFESILNTANLENLDFIVLFSSVVAFYGNSGQSDYAMANEVLNKYAYQLDQRLPGCKVITINWGPWDGGMVTPQLKKAFQEHGVDVIPVEEGVRLLLEELSNKDGGAVQIIVGNPTPTPSIKPGKTLKQYQIKRHLALDLNPFLFDHQIGGRPVLPATCGLVWIINTCEQLYPGYKFLTANNYKVLKGIVFDEELSQNHILDLKEIHKDPDGKITFEAIIWSKNKRGRVQYHYNSEIILSLHQPSLPSQPLPTQNGSPIDGQTLYEDGTLFHGPAFQGVEKLLYFNEAKLITKCVHPTLSPIDQGQFPAMAGNPYIYDTLVQGLLIWTQKTLQAPCLPARLNKVEQYKKLSFEQPLFVTTEIKSQKELAVTCDITVQNEKGEIYLKIIGLEGTISKQLNRFIGTQDQK